MPPASRTAAANTRASPASEPVCDCAARAPTSVRPALITSGGLPASARARTAADELAAVLRVLDVRRHHPRRLVVDQRPEHVRDRQVGLVADRHEPRKAQPLGGQHQADLERQVAALRDERDAAGRLVAAGRVQPRGVSSRPRQFGPSRSIAGLAHRHHQPVLDRLPLVAPLAEPGCDHHDRPDAELRARPHGLLDGGRRDRQDREIGRLVEVEQRRHGAPADHVAAPARHHVHRRRARLAEQADREPAAPLHAVVRGADERDRARLEQRRQVLHVPSIRSTPRFSRPRATISRWISDVPSQIRSTRSSRRNRSATFVRM